MPVQIRRAQECETQRVLRMNCGGLTKECKAREGLPRTTAKIGLHDAIETFPEDYGAVSRIPGVGRRFRWQGKNSNPDPGGRILSFLSLVVPTVPPLSRASQGNILSTMADVTRENGSDSKPFFSFFFRIATNPTRTDHFPSRAPSRRTAVKRFRTLSLVFLSSLFSTSVDAS